MPCYRHSTKYSDRISQYITGRGFCQAEDVMTNTIGVTIGWMIYYILHKIKIGITKE